MKPNIKYQISNILLASFWSVFFVFGLLFFVSPVRAFGTCTCEPLDVETTCPSPGGTASSLDCATACGLPCRAQFQEGAVPDFELDDPAPGAAPGAAGSSGQIVDPTGEHTAAGQGLGGAADMIKIFGRKAFGTEAPNTPVEVVAGKIIQGAMALIGVAFGILIIYGGFRWMTARGNEEDVKKSINILQAAVIGFIIVVGAYAITNYVVDTVITSAFRP